METQYLRAYRAASQESDGGPMRFVAATEGIGRDGLIIAADGWDLRNYKKNPVVLWVHDYMGQRPPIGRADVRIDGKTLIADITFDLADPFAADIARKYREGFLNAASVGWKTLEMEPSNNPKVAGRATQSELLDISGVPVPGDPDALKQRQLRGLVDLGTQLARLTGIEPDDDLPVEVDWPGTALLMARLFLADAEDTDTERRRSYARFARRYERLGKEPPEYRARADLAALELGDVRGLFLAGEPDALPELFADGTRAGAVLSRRNAGDLEQAVTLIRGVLERATKEETTPDESDHETEARVNLDLLSRLRDSINRIEVPA